jgi:hypothetical protein
MLCALVRGTCKGTTLGGIRQGVKTSVEEDKVEEEVGTAGETEELDVVGEGVLSVGERAAGSRVVKGAEDCALEVGAGTWVIVTGEGLGGTSSSCGRRERVISGLEV